MNTTQSRKAELIEYLECKIYAADLMGRIQRMQEYEQWLTYVRFFATKAEIAQMYHDYQSNILSQIEVVTIVQPGISQLALAF